MSNYEMADAGSAIDAPGSRLGFVAGSHPLVSEVFAPNDLATINESGVGQELPVIDE
jgi:hypothetical protein